MWDCAMGTWPPAGEARSMTNADLEAPVVRLDQQQQRQPPGVQQFLKAVRRVGDEDPLDGPREVIPGILAEGQSAVCPGPPGTGKTFVMADWFGRVAKGLDFQGKPVLAGGAVLVAGEGQSGLAKRVAVMASHLELTSADTFLYMRKMPRLLDPKDVTDFIAAVKIATEHWTVPVRIIGFDTFNKALVGGSENDGKDIGKLVAADYQIRKAFGCASIFSHHPGKVEGNDSRGHSSILGDFDAQAVFSGKSGVRTIEVKKQRDDADCRKFYYTLKPVAIGLHQLSGQVVSSCCVEWLDAAATDAKPSSNKWSKSLTTFRAALGSALESSGRQHRVRGDGPTVIAVDVKCVHSEHNRIYVHGGDGDRKEAERKAWQRGLKEAPRRKSSTSAGNRSRRLRSSTRST
jgi:hypothetical protein